MPFAPGLYPDGPAQGRGACGASGAILGAVRGRVPPPVKVLPEQARRTPDLAISWKYTLILFININPNINPKRIPHALH